MLSSLDGGVTAGLAAAWCGGGRTAPGGRRPLRARNCWCRRLGRKEADGEDIICILEAVLTNQDGGQLVGLGDGGGGGDCQI